ncbi:MAG TPA: hypothetical protein VN814_14610 [Caulobacteraceae bacterium]|nr:hypothetical protein [Caulobacteraceae bacterium]
MRIAVMALAVGLLASGRLQAEAQMPLSGTDQIAAPAGAADVSASQITAPLGRAAIVPNQLTRHTLRADAPPSSSTPDQGRNTNVVAVIGHDRCAPGKNVDRPECARIVESRPNEFTPAAQEQPEPVVHPDATSSGLVSDVLNGGTGSVVVLPPK